MFFLISIDKRQKTLDDAISSLNPGGKILLWEIPKTESCKKLAYYERMLTQEDILKLLKPYENKHTLETRSFEEVNHNKFKDKPLIWVIGK